MIELLIQNGSNIYAPIVEEGITWATERRGVPGQLNFNVVTDNSINFTEGNPVRLKVNDTNIFYGFVFTKKRNQDKIISVTAYDQLRYLKNKDTYVYKNKTANEVVKMIATDFVLQTGALENTSYRIASRVEENLTLTDIIHNALDLTTRNKKEIYVLFDDFGKLTLKNIKNMKVNILVDEETGESFDYTSSIDYDTYNKIRLTKDGKAYTAMNKNNTNRWGVLQYFDTLEKGENGKAKAETLLKLYNQKTRNLTVSKVLGDVRVRAGSMVVVKLNLGDIVLSNWMLVEKCKHFFNLNEHSMDLTLRGGEFVA